MSVGYRHRLTGDLYTSREVDGLDPAVRVGWEHRGTVDERISVWKWVHGAPVHAVWVSLSNLEEVDETPTQPIDVEQEHADAQRMFDGMVMSIAETLSFNIGNALLAMLEGDLNVAIEALLRERARLYAQHDQLTTNKEPQA